MHNEENDILSMYLKLLIAAQIALGIFFFCKSFIFASRDSASQYRKNTWYTLLVWIAQGITFLVYLCQIGWPVYFIIAAKWTMFGLYVTELFFLFLLRFAYARHTWESTHYELLYELNCAVYLIYTISFIVLLFVKHLPQ